MALLFLVRGVFVLSVLPPFEGWDEYQHLAYIAYLDEHGRPPVLFESEVPRSLYPWIVRYPHCKFALDQLAHIGAVGYLEYWQLSAPPVVLDDSGPIRLYQAQQASLYYRLVTPLFRWLAPADDALLTIVVLRALNALLGAAAIYVALRTIGRIVSDLPNRYILGLLIACQPLFLLNCARIANDALAIFFGTIAVSMFLCVARRRVIWSSFVGGLALGLGVMVKVIVLALWPLGFFAFAVAARYGRISRTAAVTGASIALGVTVLVIAPYLFENWARFGSLMPIQETVENRNQGRGSTDIVRAASEIDWRRELTGLFARRILWTGGWSWLSAPHALRRAHESLVYLGLVGMVFACRRAVRREKTALRRRGTFACLVLIGLGMTAALAYKMIQSQMAWGGPATNSWYAAVSFPWLLCLLHQGWRWLPTRWLPALAPLAMLAVFVAAEGYGTLAIMVPAYTGEPWGELARTRLAEMHPEWLGPGWTMPALVLSWLLILVALAATRAARREQNAISLP